VTGRRGENLATAWKSGGVIVVDVSVKQYPSERDEGRKKNGVKRYFLIFLRFSNFQFSQQSSYSTKKLTQCSN
jgi:hypothetical protein